MERRRKEIGNNVSPVSVTKTVGVEPSVSETKLEFVEGIGLELEVGVRHITVTEDGR
jgi:hypothetical protein